MKFLPVLVSLFYLPIQYILTTNNTWQKTLSSTTIASTKWPLKPIEKPVSGSYFCQFVSFCFENISLDYFYLFLILICLISRLQIVSAQRVVKLIEKTGKFSKLLFILIDWHNQNTQCFSYICTIRKCLIHSNPILHNWIAIQWVNSSEFYIYIYYQIMNQTVTDPSIISPWLKENVRCTFVDMQNSISVHVILSYVRIVITKTTIQDHWEIILWMLKSYKICSIHHWTSIQVKHNV